MGSKSQQPKDHPAPMTTYCQGMYKSRVENDINFFEIPALLSCERGNPEQENSKYDT